ncbi:hypothetical protein FACS189425_05980 [Clostridia bacterium]|nr:hypothetical protein FACS189425_05980 [Clostridia bacterium]
MPIRAAKLDFTRVEEYTQQTTVDNANTQEMESMRVFESMQIGGLLNTRLDTHAIQDLLKDVHIKKSGYDELPPVL